MATVTYRLILEGMTPEADDARVRSFIERIPGQDAVEHVMTAFPLTIPGTFDLRRATEWLDALSRAGIRGRVEVVTNAGGDAAAGAPEPPAVADEAAAIEDDPWTLWTTLLSEPERAYRGLAQRSPRKALAFGMALSALGYVLSFPGELLAARSVLGMQLTGGPAVSTWLTMALLQPALAILLWTAVVVLCLRLVRVPAPFGTTAAIVGYAQAPAVLAAVPVVGDLMAVGAFMVLVGVGVATVYELSPRQLVGFFVLPPLALLAVLMVFGVLLALAIGAFVRGPWLEQLATQLPL